MSLDKIWFIRPILGLTLLSDTKHVIDWWCWTTSMGRAAVLQTFLGFNNEKKEKTLMDNYFHNFADATGSNFTKNEIYIPATGSDVFYLPNKFFHSFQLIAGICRDSNLNLEIATPLILYGLDSPNNTELLSVKYQWHEPHKESFKARYYPSDVAFHPVKISTFKNEIERRDFCNLFVKDKFSLN